MQTPVSSFVIVFRGRCPRCGHGKLFKSFLGMHTHCPECNLHYAAREQGDGPAFIGIILMGAMATIGAAILEIYVEPPFWVHGVVWLPFILLGSLAILRLAKAWMLGMQYQLRPQDFS